MCSSSLTLVRGILSNAFAGGVNIGRQSLLSSGSLPEFLWHTVIARIQDEHYYLPMHAPSLLCMCCSLDHARIFASERQGCPELEQDCKASWHSFAFPGPEKSDGLIQFIDFFFTKQQCVRTDWEKG